MTGAKLEEMAARILAIMPRTRGKELDGAAEEIGILIGTLCETTEAAELLTAQLVAHPWRRWSFGEFAAVAKRLARPIDNEPYTAARLKSTLVPEIFSDAEYEALYRRAVKAGLKFCQTDVPDVVEAEAAARREATTRFNSMATAARKRLMEECRGVWIQQIGRSPDLNKSGRMTDPGAPFLDRNAQTIAEDRLYKLIVLGEPLFPPSTAPPAGPRENLGQFNLSKLAHKKRM